MMPDRVMDTVTEPLSGVVFEGKGTVNLAIKPQWADYVMG